MKITNKFLSLPPYLSTSWKNIASLSIETSEDGSFLCVELSKGSKIKIPGLGSSVIDTVFSTYAHFLEEENEDPPLSFSPNLAISLPGLSSITAAFQHNSEQSNTPPFPAGLLEKISTFIKGVIPEDLSQYAKPKQGCYCPYCQITRALSSNSSSTHSEDPVTEEDLKFRSWEIRQSGEKLYSVVNPLNSKECYNVFLGNPIGCTCGQTNCEHIKAVLRS